MSDPRKEAIKQAISECLDDPSRLNTLSDPVLNMMMKTAPTRYQKHPVEDVLIKGRIEEPISVRTMKTIIRRTLRMIDQDSYEQLMLPIEVEE